MKKFRKYIIILIVIYSAIALGAFTYLKSEHEDRDMLHRVEINRLQLEINDMETITDSKLDRLISDSDCITSIVYCPATDLSEEFFKEKNGMYSQINTITDVDGTIEGYAKYYYIVPDNRNSMLVAVSLFMVAAFVLSLGILIFVYHSVMKPFNKLSEMPYQLSRGNYSDEIKESKNRYFGKFIWGIGMLRDNLNEHKKNEYKLARDKKMLVLSISHDIKTPLNAINLYAKALEKGIYDSDAEKEEAAHMIQEKTTEIDEFVKEIVKSQTDDVVAIDVSIEDFYLRDLVNKICAGYSEKCKIRHTDLIINDYENHMLSGDINRIYEAVGNIIENAFKYGDGRRIEIGFAEEDYCQLISIFSSGKAVDENEMPHLFDSFFRGSNVGDREGNGLGLYICSQIMHKMNGDIYANRRDDGMEFVLVCDMS